MKNGDFMQKRMICVLLSVILSVGSVVCAGATTISGVKKQQKKTQQSLDSVNEQIDQITNDKAEADAELTQLNNQLVDILTSVYICQEEIKTKQREIRIAQEDLVEAQQKEEDQYENMKKRIQFMYERGDTAYVQALLGASDYSDMMNKADYVESLYQYDRKLLAEFVQSKEEVQQLKETLEDEEAGLRASEYELEQEQSVLENLVAEQKKTVADFDTKLANAEQEAAQYQKKLEEQTKQIKELEEEAKAEQKRKEEERKKQEEQQQQNAAGDTQQGNGASDSSATQINTGEDGKNTDASEGTSNQDTSFSAGAGAVTAGETSSGDSSSSGDASLGQQVADYACKFVGNPYVFGGTSLTTGTDCSGFTQAVFAHFGISIPRDSYSQRSSGTAVDYADARACDSISYSGHVAL